MSIKAVIVGAGPAALETALALRHHAADRVSLTLVAPDADFIYRPVSVAEPFALASARRYPLEAIARELGATHVRGRLAEVAPQTHRVRLDNGSDLAFDVL